MWHWCQSAINCGTFHVPLLAHRWLDSAFYLFELAQSVEHSLLITIYRCKLKPPHTTGICPVVTHINSWEYLVPSICLCFWWLFCHCVLPQYITWKCTYLFIILKYCHSKLGYILSNYSTPWENSPSENSPTWSTLDISTMSPPLNVTMTLVRSIDLEAHFLGSKCWISTTVTVLKKGSSTHFQP